MGGGFRGNRESYTTRTGQGTQSVNRTISRYDSTSKPKVFISFHVEDEAQVDLLRSQAKDPRFPVEFTDYSVKEPFDEKWKTQCTERIKQSSVLVVMIGPDTYSREAVLWEINKAYELGKPVIWSAYISRRKPPDTRAALENTTPRSSIGILMNCRNGSKR